MDGGRIVPLLTAVKTFFLQLFSVTLKVLPSMSSLSDAHRAHLTFAPCFYLIRSASEGPTSAEVLAGI